MKKYLENPCAALSIPYWKAKTIRLPENMKIVHERDFSSQELDEYEDEPYFRLYHDLHCVEEVDLKDFVITTAEIEDIETIVSVINRCYSDLKVTSAQMEEYTQTPVYDKNLWILVCDKKTGVCAGCGIADLDREAGELILEWIQVLPAYRNRKIGKAIVIELLSRAQAYAKFATVSGKRDNPTKPEILYRKCGFTGKDIWHIMHKNETAAFPR